MKIHYCNYYITDTRYWCWYPGTCRDLILLAVSSRQCGYM